MVKSTLYVKISAENFDLSKRGVLEVKEGLPNVIKLTNLKNPETIFIDSGCMTCVLNGVKIILSDGLGAMVDIFEHNDEYWVDAIDISKQNVYHTN